MFKVQGAYDPGVSRADTLRLTAPRIKLNTRMKHRAISHLRGVKMIENQTLFAGWCRTIFRQSVFCFLAAFLLGQGIVQAQTKTKCEFFDKFKDSNDGTVSDPRNGLMWMRCAEGFTWSGSACVGVYQRLNWEAAIEAARQSRFLEKSDWRIPTRAEFATITGRFLDCRLHNNRPENGEYAVSAMLAHPVADPRYLASLPGVFWTASKPSWGGMAYYNSFYLGLIDVSPLENEHGYRFVRSTR